MEKDLTTLTTEELDAELKKYRDLGDIEVALEADLPDDESRVAELKRLAETHGTFYVITEEDLAASPVLVENEFTAGEEVLLTADELEEIQLASESAKKAKANEASGDAQQAPTSTTAQPTTESVTPENSKSQEEAPVVAPSVSSIAGTDDLVYQGKTVLAVRDRLINGKTYKEVDIPNETHTLSLEDFTAQVLPRA